MNKRIGRQVHQWMEEAGMRQSDLAEQLGLTQAAISRKLSGERPWFPDELVAVAAVFDRTVGELFGELAPATTPLLCVVA